MAAEVAVVAAPRSRGGDTVDWSWLRRDGLRYMCGGTMVEFWGKGESMVVEL